MRVRVYGYGSMGRRHARNARALGWAVEVVETDPARVLQPLQDGFPRATGAEDIDAAIIATPASSHAEVAAGLPDVPVLIEKPLGLSVDEGERILAALSRVHVGYNWRHHPGVRLARDLMRQADVSAAQFTVVSDKTSWLGVSYADMLLEASHEIDLALWLFGPAEVTQADREDVDAWIVCLKHLSGVDSVVSLDGRQGRTPMRGLTLYGGRRSDRPERSLVELATVNVQWPGQWRLAARKLPLGIDGTTGGAYDIEQSYRDELRAFLDSVRYGGPPACSGWEALDVLRVCDEARRLVGVSA